MAAHSISSTDRTERRLLILAGAFLAVYSLTFTLSSAVRLESWQVSYHWGHWLGLAMWLGISWLAHKQLAQNLPQRDPYLFPVAALLTGWGLLTIWRLSNVMALRQTAWLVLIGMVFVLAIRYDGRQAGGKLLVVLQRFKYIWLTIGLLLTAGTLFLGTNPLGGRPRLWLGCCGVYFQPSEPLKLLLIIYLAAYLADRQVSTSSSQRLIPLLMPTLLMSGLALLLLVFQRDLGTAALFIVLYTVIVFAGTGNKNVLIVGVGILLLAGVGGYFLFDVVHQRVDAWINPWLDPSGHSYQIVQSLMAIANGGILGRGVGMGSPNLVPIAQSDFIFSAISEESGLLGSIGILGLLAVLTNRGMRVALRSADTFQRLLATGLVAHLVGQSILIIAGNLRLLPLTGVTLPFVSNGGSSLLVSFIELLLLLLISARQGGVSAIPGEKLRSQNRINFILSGGLMIGLVGAALTAGWWSLVRGPNLLNRTDNPRRSIADRYVLRGSILDRSGSVLAESTGTPGEILRRYPYPALGPLVGYTDPVYGQAGLEAGLDAYLRGLQGYPTLSMSWQQLLYGQPLRGLDVRLSLDLPLQVKADQLLAGHRGALVLMNANTGEVLVLASSPTFDANGLAAQWDSLVNDPGAPLFNRATMGLYPPGNILGGFLLAASQQNPTKRFENTNLADCALAPTGFSWADMIAAGCGEPVRQLAGSTSAQSLVTLLDGLGLYMAPPFPSETLSSSRPVDIPDLLAYLQSENANTTTGVFLRVSPLQMALAAASLSNGGERPVPRLAMVVENPAGGWVTLPVKTQSVQALSTPAATSTAKALAVPDLSVWQVVSAMDKGSEPGGLTNTDFRGFTWYIGGTLPGWKGASVALALILEENNPLLAQDIGRSMFRDALNP